MSPQNNFCGSTWMLSMESDAIWIEKIPLGITKENGRPIKIIFMVDHLYR
jgi:hypothetical protein